MVVSHFDSTMSNPKLDKVRYLLPTPVIPSGEGDPKRPLSRGDHRGVSRRFKLSRYPQDSGNTVVLKESARIMLQKTVYLRKLNGRFLRSPHIFDSITLRGIVCGSYSFIGGSCAVVLLRRNGTGAPPFRNDRGRTMFVMPRQPHRRGDAFRVRHRIQCRPPSD